MLYASSASMVGSMAPPAGVGVWLRVGDGDDGGGSDRVKAARGGNTNAPLFSSMDSMTTGSRPGNMAVRLVMASSNVMVRCAMADSWLLAVGVCGCGGG